MNQAMRRKMRGQRGQGMTEYIIIVAVIAILSLAVIMKFGNQIRNVFWASGQELAEGDGEIATDIMGDAADERKESIGDLGD